MTSLRDWDGRELSGYRHDVQIYQRPRSSWWLVAAGVLLVVWGLM